MIGIIGAGKMGTALISGLLAEGVVAPGEVMITNRSEERLKEVEQEYGVRTCESNHRLASVCGTIVLAVKPQDMGEVLESLPRYMNNLTVSLAAGYPLAVLKTAFPRAALVRAMPNLPCAVGAGATALAFERGVKAKQRSFVRQLFSSCGIVVEVNEAELDAVTAVSGSGPAFIYYIMEAMIDGGVSAGLQRDTARELVLASVSGAARMAGETGRSLRSLWEDVCSPGGTTAAGLKVLTDRKAADCIAQAVRRAAERSRELKAESLEQRSETSAESLSG